MAIEKFNHSEMIQMQESEAFHQKQRSGFSMREYKMRMKNELEPSRDKSPVAPTPSATDGYQVINYNRYNIDNDLENNNLADDFLTRPECSERKRRCSVIFNQ
jgi:hypothetical protein